MSIVVLLVVVALVLAIVSLFVDVRLTTAAVILLCVALLAGALR